MEKRNHKNIWGGMWKKGYGNDCSRVLSPYRKIGIVEQKNIFEGQKVFSCFWIKWKYKYGNGHFGQEGYNEDTALKNTIKIIPVPFLSAGICLQKKRTDKAVHLAQLQQACKPQQQRGIPKAKQTTGL